MVVVGLFRQVQTTCDLYDEMQGEMSAPEQAEIYRQRYETFRHLDKLRWQMLQIAVAAGSLSLALGRGTEAKPQGWVFVIVGLVLLVLGLAMERIRYGISMNNIVLKVAAAAIGDHAIPPPSTGLSSYSAWVAYIVVAMGVGSIAYGILGS